MSVSYVKIFNNLLDEFFVELIELFPDNNSIKVRYMLFETAIKIDVKKPCREFMFKAIPYLEKISMRDEEVLLGENAPEIISKLKIDKQDMLNLSDATKDSIWRYIKSFIAIGSKIIEMPEETHALINYIINN
jgi:hypothetical protein